MLRRFVAGLAVAGVQSAALVLSIAAYLGYDIFVRGRYEPKFGGPWDSFHLALSLWVQGVGLCAAGALVAALFTRSPVRRPAQVVAVGLVSALLLAASYWARLLEAALVAGELLPSGKGLPAEVVHFLLTVALPFALFGAGAVLVASFVVRRLWRDA